MNRIVKCIDCHHFIPASEWCPAVCNAQCPFWAADANDDQRIIHDQNKAVVCESFKKLEVSHA